VQKRVFYLFNLKIMADLNKTIQVSENQEVAED
jgi:hypothetical protein